ncbi:hypothetical protein C2G38_2110025 [Gigaspora rosea]|uniref:Uncharacterized protein n=1 Tax=Gigaspora rosea TaxID=44941 RepID=A0A397UJB9_9GLOM|nr:hypothetical protein C2G38_2110025 [Gigaspora rosea]
MYQLNHELYYPFHKHQWCFVSLLLSYMPLKGTIFSGMFAIIDCMRRILIYFASVKSVRFPYACDHALRNSILLKAKPFLLINIVIYFWLSASSFLLSVWFKPMDFWTCHSCKARYALESNTFEQYSQCYVSRHS